MKSVFRYTKRPARTPPPSSQRPVSKSSHPPLPRFFQETVKREETMDHDLEVFHTQAQADLATAMKTGNGTNI